AEDGIRDYKVTGVQTCALPISGGRALEDQVLDEVGDAPALRRLVARPRVDPDADRDRADLFHPLGDDADPVGQHALPVVFHLVRSEERRVGKESRTLAARVDL